MKSKGLYLLIAGIVAVIGINLTWAEEMPKDTFAADSERRLLGADLGVIKTGGRTVIQFSVSKRKRDPRGNLWSILHYSLLFNEKGEITGIHVVKYDPVLFNKIVDERIVDEAEQRKILPQFVEMLEKVINAPDFRFFGPPGDPPHLKTKEQQKEYIKRVIFFIKADPRYALSVEPKDKYFGVLGTLKGNDTLPDAKQSPEFEFSQKKRRVEHLNQDGFGKGEVVPLSPQQGTRSSKKRSDFN